MIERFDLRFPNGRAAVVVALERPKQLPDALAQIELVAPRSALVLVGGAGGLSYEDGERLRPLMTQGIAALAQQHNLCVVSGGTDAGIMRLMGQARAEIDGTFPLIGVCPVGRVSRSNFESMISRYSLEPSHSHFVLVPGSDWAEGAHWQAQVAGAIAGNAHSVTVLMNGGEVAWIDVSASVQAQRRVVVVSGSGRTADALAGALRGEIADNRARRLIATGLIDAVNSIENPKIFTETLERYFQ